MRFFPVLLVFFLSASAARADNAPAACNRADGECGWLATGVERAEDIAASGSQLFRFHVAGHNVPNRIYQVTRSPGGTVLLDIRPVEWRRGEVTATVDVTVWNHLIERWKKFEHDEDAFIAIEAKKKPVVRTDAKGQEIETITVCTDGYDIEFETVLGGKIARRSPDTCVHPRVDEIFDELPAYLLAQVPYCRRIPEKLRDACFGLEGDRFEAADAVAPIYGLAGGDMCKADNAAALEDLFAPDAKLTWNGQARTGADVVDNVRESLCGTAHRFLWIDLIEGRPDGAVVVTGAIRYSDETQGPRRGSYEAPFTQVWRRDGAGRYRIASWDMGAFVRAP